MPAALWTRWAESLTVPPKGCKLDRFQQAAAAAGVDVCLWGIEEGFNYSKTRRVRVDLCVVRTNSP